jgi:hypothetical protein
MDFRKPRVWDYTITTGTALTCFALGSVTAPFHGALGTMIDPSLLLVGLVLCGVGATGATAIERRGETDAETDGVIVDWNTGQILPPNPPRPTESDLNPILRVDGKIHAVYQQDLAQVKQRDSRLQQWAYAVAYNNAPMTQKKWCGGKRLFSKPEYERWISCLLEKQVLTFANPKNPAGGYKPNGAQGWQTIKSIADNKTYIPLPAAVLSQEQVRFVSARLRERSAVGEGRE